MTKEKLEEILENHKHWLAEDCDGWEEMRANLCGMDLHDMDLSGVDLRAADLSSANLCHANLGHAYMRLANLYNADLREADLSGTDLSEANLSRSNLCSVNFYNVNLRNAELYNAKNVPFIPYICPEFGSFIGYKKAVGDYIVEIQILEDAKRLSATTRKCRCNKAKVLGIYDYQHNLLDIKEVKSSYDSHFVYKVGEIVEVDNFDEDRWNECSTGIHFFINFQEAVDYY